MGAFPSKVKIVEVGPRDGLQNEAHIVDAQTKIEFINQLSNTGVKNIEAGSFVSPKAIPQLADSDAVFNGIKKHPGVVYSALVPNMKGMERALAAGVDAIAVFTAASEVFSEKNTNCSIEQSLQRFEPVIKQAKDSKIQIRAYISCVLGCPYEGRVAVKKVVQVAGQLRDMGCDEISLGDTIGVGTALQTQDLITELSRIVPIKQLAVHFHDTYGQALANIFASLELGISIIDASVAGLGGCPYAKGASGNVATEDVVYMLQGMGIDSGIDLDLLIQVGRHISLQLQRPITSRVGVASTNKG